MIDIKKLNTETTFSNAFVFILTLESGGGGNVRMNYSHEVTARDDESKGGWDIVVNNPSLMFEFCIEPVELASSLGRFKANSGKRGGYQIVSDNVESRNDTDKIDLPNGQRMVTYRRMVSDRWSIHLMKKRDHAVIIETEDEFVSLLIDWCQKLGADEATTQVVTREFLRRFRRKPVKREAYE